MRLMYVSSVEFPATLPSEVEFTLDQRDGLMFRVVGSTFSTPVFSKDTNSIPIIMTHPDRSESNVTVTVVDGVIKITQNYIQSKSVIIETCADETWCDSGELQNVYVETADIAKVVTTDGTEVNVTASLSSGKTRLRTTGFNPGAADVYIARIILASGRVYMAAMTMSSHKATETPVSYDYATIDIPLYMQAFTT